VPAPLHVLHRHKLPKRTNNIRDKEIRLPDSSSDLIAIHIAPLLFDSHQRDKQHIQATVPYLYHFQDLIPHFVAVCAENCLYFKVKIYKVIKNKTSI
jgi:hypothetical protein